MMNTNSDLVKYLTGTKAIHSESIKKAFLEVDRADFVPNESLMDAYGDFPLPIECGQTISQPRTVAFMLELLDVKPDFSVLDIGCGSGYTTALLSSLVGLQGFVLGVDLHPELIDFATRNLSRYLFPQAKIKCVRPLDTDFEGAPFDRILVSASAKELPKEYVQLLKTHGIMVIPIGEEIVKVTKTSSTEISLKHYPNFRFVPLITERQK